MIELKALSAGYRKKTVLSYINIRFDSGCVTSIIGVNGCGKSTLLKTAAGGLPCLCGEVFVDREPLSALSHTERARRISYLPQGRDLPDMTVMTLVLHGRFPYLGFPCRYSAADRRAAGDALERVGISHLKNSTLAELSCGQRQKAYLAMLLAQQTENVLLDEPTSFLDISCLIDTWKLCRDLANDGRCVVCVSHDISQALKYSDRIALLDNGTLRAYSTPTELLDSGIMNRVFGVRITDLGGMEVKIEK